MIRFTCTKPFTIEGTDDSLFQWGGTPPRKALLTIFLEVLVSKLGKGGECPDEIGVFLGYPLKDVLGFIDIRHYSSQKYSTGVFMEMQESQTRSTNGSLIPAMK